MNNSSDLVPQPGEETETDAALKRLLQSERFRKNASLQHMLEYLVTRTLSGEQHQIKETTVAIDVFGRQQDFDSRIDNIVRVQAHRLRKLLTSYYEAEGAQERIRFSIPRGGYIPHVETIGPVLTSPAAIASPASPVTTASIQPDFIGPVLNRLDRPGPNMLTSAAVGFLIGLFVSLAAFAVYRVARPEIKRAEGSESAHSQPLASVWGAILKPGVPCVVSYSNPVFLATGDPPAPRILVPYSGPLSAPPGARINVLPSDLDLSNSFAGRNPAFYFSDGWTGVGEVAAMQRLTSLLSPEVALRVIRSRALMYTDVQGSNVIFLGSSWANDMQKKINIGFTPLMNDNDGNIVNLEPQSGEATKFRAQVDATTRQITSTYGLFSVLPGVLPGAKVFICAGVNTYGTAAAAEFMTSTAGVREVMHRLRKAGSQELPEFFQAVIRAEMIRGEPAETRLVLVRALKRKS